MNYNAEKYQDKLLYPIKPKEPFLKNDRPDKQELDNYIKAQEKYENDLVEWRGRIEAYNAEKKSNWNKFVNDVLENCGLTNFSKEQKDAFISYISNEYRSEYEMWNAAEEITDLILKFVK